MKFQINFYARDFSTTSLSTYDYSTLYTTLSHNLLKINLSFSLKEPSKEKALLTLHVTNETRFSLQNSRKNIIHDLIKMYVMLDNLFIRFGTKLHGKVKRIPIGTNCATFITYLFVFCFKMYFMIYFF